MDEENCEIYSAIINGDYEELKSILERGGKSDIGIYRMEYIHFAIDKKRLDLVQLLVEYNFDIEFFKGDGFTPLIFSIRSGTFDIFKFLLESGAKYKNDRILKFIRDDFYVEERKEFERILEEYESKLGNIKPAKKIL